MKHLYLSVFMFVVTMVLGVTLDIIIRDYGASGVTTGGLCFMFGTFTFVGSLFGFVNYLESREK